MRISSYCVQVFHGAHEEESGMVGQQFFAQKGQARQACVGAATVGREAILHQVEVDGEPRDILVAGLEGELEEMTSSTSLETYTPGDELKLAPGAFAWTVVQHVDAEE